MQNPKTENKRSAEEILRELCEEIVKYNALRDDEWDFEDEHGDRAFWNEIVESEHQSLLNDIQKGRERVRGLLREATGDESMDF